MARRVKIIYENDEKLSISLQCFKCKPKEKVHFIYFARVTQPFPQDIDMSLLICQSKTDMFLWQGSIRD